MSSDLAEVDADEFERDETKPMKLNSMKLLSHHPDRSPPRRSRQSARRAFTLIEMITVITIIILVLAAALPVWNVLTGNRSLEAGYNQVSAMIGTARADAVYNRAEVGVVFFVDPANGQVTMGEVRPDSPTAPDNAALNYGATSVDFFGRDFSRETVPLPTGVGVALYNNQPNGATNYDRYVRFGVIMFDATGTVEPFAYGVRYSSQLGNRLGLATGTTDLQANGTAPSALTSQVGILLYDRVTFASYVASKVGASIPPDQDMDYTLPNQVATVTSTQKIPEETWLDNNGLSALVSPANGSLIKSK
jgi:type II secretory pathway pseudopilin PulG